MGFTVASALAAGSAADAAARLATDLRRGLGAADPALVVVFASTAQPLGEVVGPLSRALPTATVLGASSSGEFTDAATAKGSVSALAVAGDVRVFAGMGRHLRDRPDAAVRAAVSTFPQELDGYPHRTALLLLDPLAGNGEETTLLAATHLGDDVLLAGGAAADDLRMTRTDVSVGATAATDAVVVAVLFTKQPLGVGVQHGHRPLSAPLRVTSASGATVKTIEGRPAWEVWREQTHESAKAAGIDPDTLPASAEGGYLLRFEAGLAAGGEYTIRAPLSRDEDGAIQFACGIPEGAVLRITESRPEWQVESARVAARRARERLGGGPVAGALVFDCICRDLILGEGFATAVAAMGKELGGAPLAGFETYGEIALDVGDLSGFHNTTSVVLAFPA